MAFAVPIWGQAEAAGPGGVSGVTLASARSKRDDAKALLATGIDPSVQARHDKLAKKTAAGNTFGLIADEYLAKLALEKRAEATLSKTRWLLDFVRPLLGTRPISEISAPEVLAVLRTVERRGRLESARRLRSTIGRVFRYAIATTRASSDPTIALQGALVAPQVTPRAAILGPEGFGGLLRAIEEYDGQPAIKAALQLMALLFPRPGELRFACWSEFDLEGGVWMILAERTKMRRPHSVPLARQARVILENLREVVGNTELVIPSVRSPRRPISENTMNVALRRLGYGKEEMMAHGFRASASTLLNESGKWRPDVIERQLGHVEGNDVRRAYARGEYWDERVGMMTWWADYLDMLRDESHKKFQRTDPNRPNVR